jgi:hypothetical protein
MTRNPAAAAASRVGTWPEEGLDGKVAEVDGVGA